MKPFLALAFLALPIQPSAAQIVENPALGVPVETEVGPREPVDVKAAFVGDSTDGGRARAVFKLIRDEGAEVVFHQGDFDYEEDTSKGPPRWKKLLDEALGGLPFIAALGNHDMEVSSKPETKGLDQAYVADLAGRTGGAVCEGKLGIKAACAFRGLFVVSSAVTMRGGKRDQHAKFIREKMAESRARWKICAWHKVENKMQIGAKTDGPGWEVYEACREAGALVATAHEHTYSRTFLISDFPTQAFDPKAPLKIEPGKTIAFVSGLGGAAPRVRKRNDPWMAAAYSRDDDKKAAGALFCHFRDAEADCYFKDVNGSTIDSFQLLSGL